MSRRTARTILLFFLLNVFFLFERVKNGKMCRVDLDSLAIFWFPRNSCAKGGYISAICIVYIQLQCEALLLLLLGKTERS